MIRITDQIEIDERDLAWAFVRAAGPGGQNVNKVATAAELRFDAMNALLPEDMKQRLRILAGRQMTQDGVLVITSREHRSQERNRDTALAKLVALLRRAAVRPKRRIATRPTKGSKERRLQSKAKRSGTKKLRSGKPSFD
ncbi:MAG: aminoacyl-tRNA hydrolase [Rhizobiales bacterium]|nr:aminoacyl-tRNA hydrolase [Hyphomicrobiales bacterium]